MADIVILTLGPLWTIDEVKQHMRVEGDEEDDLIQVYMDAAEQAMLTFCNISLVPQGREAVFKTAGMLTVSAFYDEREGSDDSMPSSARRLLHPYRWIPV